MGGDVKVEVQGFFKQCGRDDAVGYVDGDIQEVDMGPKGLEVPFDTMVIVHIRLEHSPIIVVDGGVVTRDPDPTDIINVAFVASNVGMTGEDPFFVDCKK